mmetsp:Transcript_26759/g.37233  ORF Transcript_26759/g.37233 Transcript_26759/m.37233 type:complete len:263 (-) Transcript_26759:376-1164(-)|eukprot:CAMPEP_0184480060 /NCGR_PEP_ID=MMETSP0113_2-20130426/1545_1 /TAXON_ID=91329 /ORGANISM="Norrisiella sphaerica, Strain BC52" /LENGTH=262 /DNA_ID=CAMNT_0026858295 /DNA_START=103 /DNA_END=891 /DNA_ORIENTATION=-
MLYLALIASALTSALAAPVAPKTAMASKTTHNVPMRRARQPLASRFGGKMAVRSSEAEAPAPVAEGAPARQPYRFAKGTAPMGEFFDPLGISKGKSESELKRLREAELTHGRVSMLAVLGFLFQEALLDRPLFSNAKGSVNGPAIFHFQEVSERYPFFWLATIPFFAFFENKRARIGWQDPTKGGDLFGLKEDYIPGELGFDPFQAYPLDSNGKQDMKNKELNNGRLAMLAAAGFMAQELVNKKTIYENLGLDKLVPPHGPF